MILLYHSVIPEGSPVERLCVGQALRQGTFEQHVDWLANKYPLVSLGDYLAGWQNKDFHKENPIALTFDDGYGVTFQCIFPFLVKKNIPAAIFISTGHLEAGELLWFSFLKALCFENLYQHVNVKQLTFPLQTIDQCKRAWDGLRALAKTSGDPVDFCKTLASRYPLTPQVSALYAGMTFEQVKMAGESSVITLGAHTIVHPFLDHLTKAEQEKEITGSQNELSKIIKKPIRYFAYPGGDYNHDTVDVVRAAGFEASFATLSKNVGKDPRYEIGRIGVYSPSLLKLQLKTLGLADWTRRLGLRVG